MEPVIIDKEVARRSALIYLPISLGAALFFLLAASLAGDYPPVAKIGGMVWVGLLSLIVSMPIVTSGIKHHKKRVDLELAISIKLKAT